MLAAKGKPWTFPGVTDVTDCTTVAEVMKEANLDWIVDKCELVAHMPNSPFNVFDKEAFEHNGDTYKICPNAYATYRTDKNIPLGIVKERYTPVQNTDAFAFFDGAIGKDKAIWQTAGCFGNGERIFVSAKLPNTIMVEGDPVENYLTFINSHDGSSGVKILISPIRVICQNMLNAAIRNASNYMSFRHTKSVHDNISVVQEILATCNNETLRLKEQFVAMRKKMIEDKQAQEIFANVILNDKEKENIRLTGHTIQQVIIRDWRAIEDSGISMKKVNVLSEMNNYYFNGIGQKEILGTAWGAYNAVTGYYSNVDKAEGAKRMDSLLFGDKSNKIKLAGDLALAV